MVIKGINIKRRELSDDDKIGDNVVETLKFGVFVVSYRKLEQRNNIA